MEHNGVPVQAYTKSFWWDLDFDETSGEIVAPAISFVDFSVPLDFWKLLRGHIIALSCLEQKTGFSPFHVHAWNKSGAKRALCTHVW